ncbi:hypothetical protein GCM10009583_09500 [Ornithinicoccus hortensis]|uniref:2-keto-4-pentenoate hydratase n=2 Tax=Ornithinicoccus hortensis TaxID=82346 RepID=A0A542YRA4_9MICO|nr:2-keto-4-pentenoate hydratase [Ornithinicoccus hortensis]
MLVLVGALALFAVNLSVLTLVYGVFAPVAFAVAAAQAGALLLSVDRPREATGWAVSAGFATALLTVGDAPLPWPVPAVGVVTQVVLVVVIGGLRRVGAPVGRGAHTMLDEQATKQAFKTLWAAHEGGYTVDGIPEEVRPRTRAEGYAVQAHFAGETAAVAGWKIAATSQAGQDHLQVDGPLAGRVLSERLLEPGQPVPLDGNFMNLAELEYAFRMVTDLPPRDTAYSEQEVLDAAGELLLSWEIPSTRFDAVETVGEAQLIADNACGFHLVVQPAADQDWKGVDLAAETPSATHSSGLVHDGAGHRVLGGPVPALTWLVNELSGHGITLEAGQLVTTGTCAVPMPIAPGDSVTGDYGRFGSLTVTFC